MWWLYDHQFSKVCIYVTMIATFEKGTELCEIFTYVTMIATLERLTWQWWQGVGRSRQAAGRLSTKEHQLVPGCKFQGEVCNGKWKWKKKVKVNMGVKVRKSKWSTKEDHQAPVCKSPDEVCSRKWKWTKKGGTNESGSTKWKWEIVNQGASAKSSVQVYDEVCSCKWKWRSENQKVKVKI